MVINPTALVAWRKERGLTMTALAEEADVALGYLHAIEHGQRNPSPDIIRRLASTIKVDLRCIITDPNETNKEPVA